MTGTAKAYMVQRELTVRPPCCTPTGNFSPVKTALPFRKKRGFLEIIEDKNLTDPKIDYDETHL